MTPLYGLAAELASSQTRKGMMVSANKSSSNLTNDRRCKQGRVENKVHLSQSKAATGTTRVGGDGAGGGEEVRKTKPSIRRIITL